MELFETILFYSHLLGFAAVVGGLMNQLGAKAQTVTKVMLNGVRWQLLSGLALAGFWHDEYNTHVVVTKIVLAVAIAGICEAFARKKSLSKQVFYILIGLVLVQTAVALFVAVE